MSWTEERTERLKALWKKGISDADIAAELGGVTRNAVIGKVHRLGLAGRSTPSGRVRGRQKSKPQPAQTEPYADNVHQLPGIRSKEITALEQNECRWPVGKRDGTHVFCGAVSQTRRF